jgi:hypothetical protein
LEVEEKEMRNCWREELNGSSGTGDRGMNEMPNVHWATMIASTILAAFKHFLFI